MFETIIGEYFKTGKDVFCNYYNKTFLWGEAK